MSTAWQQKYPVPVSLRYGFFWGLAGLLGLGLATLPLGN